MQRAVGLRAALELAQRNLGVIGRLRYRDNIGEALADGLLTCLGNLVIAVICLRDATKFVKDDLSNLAHLAAQIGHRKVPGPVLRRIFRLLSTKVEILRSQLGNDCIAQAVGDCGSSISTSERKISSMRSSLAFAAAVCARA
jgi:hypothetical protein